MNFLQLKYFQLLAQVQHVSKTAEMLYISQPSLSSTIKKLEEELDCSLFERSGRNIKLSKYGSIYLDYVNNAFNSLEQGKLKVRRMKNRDESNIVLGMLSPYIWQDMIHEFTEKNAKIAIM